MNKRGVVSIYLSLIFLVIIIICIAAVVAPLGARFITEMYLAGDQIMRDTNSSIQGIMNSQIREQVQTNLDAAVEAQGHNIDVNIYFFRYSWILVIGLGALVAFIQTRALVEVSGGFV